jgi:hypothetical protein
MIDLIGYQRDLFANLDQFFTRVTGETAENFASPGDFSQSLPLKGPKIVSRGRGSWEFAHRELLDFYMRNKALTPNLVGYDSGGFKLVLGGSSKFLQTHYEAVRSCLLWADTILISDPVLPLLIEDRGHEKYIRVQLVQVVHSLLHLRPFIENDFRYCPN